MLIGATDELWHMICRELHPDLKRVLMPERLALDVADATLADVNRAAAPLLVDAERRHADEQLARLRDHLGTGARAVAGLEQTLESLVERRVEVLLYDAGFHQPGAVCPRGHRMSAQVAGECPIDGTPLEPRPDIVELAIESAISQSAEPLALSDRPELGPLGSIAAILRF